MSWLDHLRWRSSAHNTGGVTFPVGVDLGTGLRAHIYSHEVDTSSGTVSCWSYITDGLMSREQREIVFTLRCKPHERPDEFPRDPLYLFQSIYELAGEGRVVSVGGVTQFDGRNLFGRHLAYIQAEPFPNVAVPAHALAAILVTEDEVRAVQEFGILRPMSRLGFASRCRPETWWTTFTS